MINIFRRFTPSVEKAVTDTGKKVATEIAEHRASLKDTVHDAVMTSSEASWIELEDTLSHLISDQTDLGTKLKLRHRLKGFLKQFKEHDTRIDMDDIVKQAQEHYGLTDAEMPSFDPQLNIKTYRGMYSNANHSFNVRNLTRTEVLEQMRFGVIIKVLPKPIKNFLNNSLPKRLENTVAHEISHSRTGLLFRHKLSNAEVTSINSDIISKLNKPIPESIEKRFVNSSITPKDPKDKIAEEAYRSIAEGNIRRFVAGGLRTPAGSKEYLMTGDEILARRQGVVFESRHLLEALSNGPVGRDDVLQLKAVLSELKVNRQIRDLKLLIKSGGTADEINNLEQEILSALKNKQFKKTKTGQMLKFYKLSSSCLEKFDKSITVVRKILRKPPLEKTLEEIMQAKYIAKNATL